MYPFLEVGYTCTKYDNHIFRTLVFPAGIATHAVLVMSILLVVFKVQGKADSKTVIYLLKFVYLGDTPTMVKITRRGKHPAYLALQFLVEYLFLYKKNNSV